MRQLRNGQLDAINSGSRSQRKELPVEAQLMATEAVGPSAATREQRQTTSNWSNYTSQEFGFCGHVVVWIRATWYLTGYKWLLDRIERDLSVVDGAPGR